MISSEAMLKLQRTLSESSLVTLPRNVGWADSKWAYPADIVAHLGCAAY